MELRWLRAFENAIDDPHVVRINLIKRVPLYTLALQVSLIQSLILFPPSYGCLGTFALVRALLLTSGGRDSVTHSGPGVRETSLF